MRQLVRQNHDRIGHGGEYGAQQPPGTHAVGGGLSADEKGAQQRGCQRDDLGKGDPLLQKKRGKQDHERRPRVIDEHAEADADLGISLKQQQPLHRHSHAGKGNEQKIPLVVHECEAVAGGEKQRQQQAAAQHGAEQHDLIAAQMDEAGHHSVGAEDQQAGKVF